MHLGSSWTSNSADIDGESWKWCSDWRLYSRDLAFAQSELCATERQTRSRHSSAIRHSENSGPYPNTSCSMYFLSSAQTASLRYVNMHKYPADPDQPLIRLAPNLHFEPKPTKIELSVSCAQKNLAKPTMGQIAILSDFLQEILMPADASIFTRRCMLSGDHVFLNS